MLSKYMYTGIGIARCRILFDLHIHDVHLALQPTGKEPGQILRKPISRSSHMIIPGKQG